MYIFLFLLLGAQRGLFWFLFWGKERGEGGLCGITDDTFKATMER